MGDRGPRFSQKNLHAGLTLDLFSATLVQGLEPALEACVAFIPPKTLKSCYGNDDLGDGIFVRMSDQPIGLTLRQLKALAQLRQLDSLGK